MELQKRLPVVRQALRVAQSNSRERGRLPGLCLPKKVRIPLEENTMNSSPFTSRVLDVFYRSIKNVFSMVLRNYVNPVPMV